MITRTARPPVFTLVDAERANDAWGANCGPGALAAVLGITLDQVRPHLCDFETKHYMNPTMMFAALHSIGCRWRKAGKEWPSYGLCRIQWEGPWTAEGVPMQARYRCTHWVGAAKRGAEVGIFDINCLNNGSGWCSLENWKTVLVPALLAETHPRADGKRHVTHAIEVYPEAG